MVEVFLCWAPAALAEAHFHVCVIQSAVDDVHARAEARRDKAARRAAEIERRRKASSPHPTLKRGTRRVVRT